MDHSYFAPESLLDDKGRRIRWTWIFDAPGFKTRGHYGWSGTMRLPRVLALGPDGGLRMNPPEEIERLRYNGRKQANPKVKAATALALEGIAGQSLELDLTMTAKDAKQFGLKVCCSPGGEEPTLIYYDVVKKTEGGHSQVEPPVGTEDH